LKVLAYQNVFNHTVQVRSVPHTSEIHISCYTLDTHKMPTRSSRTPGSFFSSSKNDEKNSDRSTWRGATHRVSISAPETDSPPPNVKHL